MQKEIITRLTGMISFEQALSLLLIIQIHILSLKNSLIFFNFVHGCDYMSILSDIRDYIVFISKEHGLSISMHTQSFDSVILSKELSAFNIHGNSYCSYIKSCPKAATAGITAKPANSAIMVSATGMITALSSKLSFLER